MRFALVPPNYIHVVAIEETLKKLAQLNLDSVINLIQITEFKSRTSMLQQKIEDGELREGLKVIYTVLLILAIG